MNIKHHELQKAHFNNMDTTLYKLQKTQFHAMNTKCHELQKTLPYHEHQMS